MIIDIPKCLSTDPLGFPHHQHPKNMKSSKTSQLVNPNHSVRLGLEVPTGALLSALIPEWNAVEELQRCFKDLEITTKSRNEESDPKDQKIRVDPQLTTEDRETIELCRSILVKLSRFPEISKNAENSQHLTAVMDKFDMIEQKYSEEKEKKAIADQSSQRNNSKLPEKNKPFTLSQNLWSFSTQNRSLINFKWRRVAQVSSLHELKIVLSGNIPGSKLGLSINDKNTFAADLISNMRNLPIPIPPAELESYLDEVRKSNRVAEYNLNIPATTLVFKEFFDKNVLPMDENPTDAESLSFILLQYKPKSRIIVVFAENFDDLVK